MSPLSGECFECGGQADVEHHVVPRSRGGTKTVPLCDLCHGKSHGRLMTTNALTKEAISRKRANGERVGQVPFGWDFDGTRLVESPAEQAVVLDIIKYRNSGWSLRRIAKHLESRLIRTKKGGPWHPASVHSIVLRYQKEADHGKT
jgi:hypothetical protein